jgi:protein ImuB
VWVIACIWYPRFALAVLTHGRVDPAGPIAIHAALDAHPRIVECSALARSQGVEPGMLLGRAMGACPDLQLVEHDVAMVEDRGVLFVERLEELGAGVEMLRPGRVLFAVRPLMRLYGGEQGVVERVFAQFPRVRDVLRIGIGPNRFVAEVAAWRARPGTCLSVGHDNVRELLAPLPARILPIDSRMLETWNALGLETLAHVAALQRSKVAERFGPAGVALHRLACGVDDRPVVPRPTGEVIEESMTFPEAMGNVMTLERAVGVLVERALARPYFDAYAPRTVQVVAELVEGGMWRQRKVLRQPTTVAVKVALAASVLLEQIPAPVERLLVRFDQFVPHAREQQELDSGSDHERRNRLQAGVRHVQAALDDEAVLSVLEVAPHSRVPERRAVLVPADIGGGREAAAG